MKQKNYQEIKDKFKSWTNNKTDEDLIQEDEFMLMANYLSELERLKRLEGLKLKRNELADQIGVSASYLTQVFNGDKPLNFYTIAKIQRALNIRFHVRAYQIDGNRFVPYDLHNTVSTENPHTKGTAKVADDVREIIISQVQTSLA